MLSRSAPRSSQRQAGLSLVELMVGLVVGLIVMLAATAMFITTSQSSREGTALARLSNENVTVMNIMTNEIRRAGASAFTATNFYMQADNDLFVSNDGRCVLFSYDRTWSADSATPAFNPVNFFGFRLNAQGQLEMRTGGTGRSNDCAATNIVWQTLTDPSTVTITPVDAATPVFAINYVCVNTDDNSTRNAGRCNATNAVFVNAAAGDRLLEIRSVRIRYIMRSARFNEFATNPPVDQEVLVRNSRRVVKS